MSGESLSVVDGIGLLAGAADVGAIGDPGAVDGADGPDGGVDSTSLVGVVIPGRTHAST